MVYAMDGDAARRRVERHGWRPRNCVWELTLGCNLRCEHCGSRAGRVRPDELSLDECLDVVQQLADLGTELVTLSGGEPTLKKGWDTIARAIADHGIYVNMVTNGVYRSGATADEVAQRALDAGMCNVGVSIDGTEDVHDEIRGAGTFAASMASIERFVAAGMRVGVMTTVNRRNLPLLPEVRRAAIDVGATMWRLQLGKPMGSMDDHRDWMIRPTQLLTLLPLLAELKLEGGIHVAVGDSLGYYGQPGKVLRGRGWRGRKECWKGCQAGMQAIGIEADGGVKGCLSLQAKWGDRDPFVEGNLRERSLADLWYAPGMFAFNREFEVDTLTGGCRPCRHAKLCRGGARCVSSAVLGSLTEDPYCYHGVLTAERARRAGVTQQLGASAAGAALAVTLGTAGCGTTEMAEVGADVTDLAGDGAASPDTVDVAPADTLPDTPAPDTDPDAIAPDTAEEVSLEYGIPPDVGPDLADAIDAADTAEEVSPDYGIPPDAGPDVAEDPDSADAADAADSAVEVSPDYGIPPDVVEDVGADVHEDAAPDVAPEYGIPPDAGDDAADFGTDADEEVSLEYGIPPDVGTDADGGDDAVDCTDACCDCDYGEPPPPECCP